MIEVRTSTTEISVRPARFDEAANLSEILAAAYAQYELGFAWPEIWDHYLAEVTDVAGRWESSLVLVAECAGVVVGCVDYYEPFADGYAGEGTIDLIEPGDRDSLSPPLGSAAIRCLAVDPIWRGSGAGRALVTASIDRARADGASQVFLHSLPMMTAAVDLYQSVGFRRTPDLDFGIIGGGHHRVLAFLLPLTSSP